MMTLKYLAAAGLLAAAAAAVAAEGSPVISEQAGAKNSTVTADVAVQAPAPAVKQKTALSPEEWQRVLAAMPKAEVMNGFAVHSKQFCGSCHGPNGISQTSAWPHVAGQPFEVTAKALLDYRDGRRSGGERAKLMVAAVKTMTDQQIADVAAMYAMLPGPDGTKLEVGKKNMADTSGIDVSGLVRKGDPKRAITPCAACHGTTGKGRATGSVPVIHGQNPAYLAGQLRDYRDGRRTNDILKEMRFFVQKLTDDEINALAVYYASQAGRPGSKP